VAKYLSVEWIDDLHATARANRDLQETSRHYRLRVTETVTGAPDGDVTYHLILGDGSINIGAGPGEKSDVYFEQDYATAVGLATGVLNAQTAFVSGQLRVTGDMDLLMASQPVFAALDAVFNDVRSRTEFV
jgi:putative sterol carrier protein